MLALTKNILNDSSQSLSACLTGIIMDLHLLVQNRNTEAAFTKILIYNIFHLNQDVLPAFIILGLSGHKLDNEFETILF